MMNTSFSIRFATINDLTSITEIYNEAILNTTATFDTEPKTIEQQKKWFNSHRKYHPILVAETKNKITGWASLSKWSDRCSYDTTVELSVYVHKDFHGQGIGKKLLARITEERKNAGVHTILARIVEGNASSIHLHEAAGYEHVRVMKQVGKKFGKFLDVYLMQKLF